VKKKLAYEFDEQYDFATSSKEKQRVNNPFGQKQILPHEKYPKNPHVWIDPNDQTWFNRQTKRHLDKLKRKAELIKKVDDNLSSSSSSSSEEELPIDDEIQRQQNKRNQLLAKCNINLSSKDDAMFENLINDNKKQDPDDMLASGERDPMASTHQNVWES